MDVHLGDLLRATAARAPTVRNLDGDRDVDIDPATTASLSLFPAPGPRGERP